MKKVTLISLIVFLIAVVGIFTYALWPVAPAHVVETPTPTTTPIVEEEPVPVEPTPTPAPVPVPKPTPTPVPPPSSKPVLSMSEVVKHNQPTDCYLVINNNVYDVSSYVDRHPGGRKSLTNECGQEASSIFARIHSNRAWDLLAKYKIGVLVAN